MTPERTDPSHRARPGTGGARATRTWEASPAARPSAARRRGATRRGHSPITYNSYLKVPELLALQVPRSRPPHHDEHLFIIIHQTYELWFNLILHELESAIASMREARVLRAHHFVSRVVAIMRVLVDQIHILETMEPIEFLGFRERLNPASGFQSIQFRELEFALGIKDSRMCRALASHGAFARRLGRRLAGPDVRTSFYGLLEHLGFPMPPPARHADADTDRGDRERVLGSLEILYSNPEANLPLYLLAESLIALDEQVSLWRYHHVQVVERVIGRKPGTGGSEGVAYLATTLGKRAFPLLWEVRRRLERPAVRLREGASARTATAGRQRPSIAHARRGPRRRRAGPRRQRKAEVGRYGRV